MKVSRTLDELRKAAEGKKNVMPKLIAFVQAYTTMGERVKIFREVYRVYREASFL
jgi:methylmalonyl-CoA mutase N-terminal domain/subunit